MTLSHLPAFIEVGQLAPLLLLLPFISAIGSMSWMRNPFLVLSWMSAALVHAGFGWTSEAGRHDSQLLTAFESFRGLLFQNFRIVVHSLILFFF